MECGVFTHSTAILTLTKLKHKIESHSYIFQKNCNLLSSKFLFHDKNSQNFIYFYAVRIQIRVYRFISLGEFEIFISTKRFERFSTIRDDSDLKDKWRGILIGQVEEDRRQGQNRESTWIQQCRNC